MRRLLAGLLVVVALLAIAACGGSASNSADPTADALAHFEHGRDSADDISLALDTLAQVCTQARTKVADIVQATWNDLEDNGIDDSMVDVADALWQAVPTSSAPMNCEEVAAAYLVLREN